MHWRSSEVSVLLFVVLYLMAEGVGFGPANAGISSMTSACKSGPFTNPGNPPKTWRPTCTNRSDSRQKVTRSVRRIILANTDCFGWFPAFARMRQS